MSTDTTHIAAAVSMERERFVVMSMAEGKIAAMESHELVHPFGLESFVDDTRHLEVYQDALENLVQKCHIAGQRVGVVIGEDMVCIKRIPVALGLDQAALKEQMEWESEQILLSPLKKFRMVYQRLPAKTAAGNPYYLLVLIRKHVLQSLKTLVESAGVALHDIEVDLFAHLRALQMNYVIDPDDIMTLLQIHDTGLLFTIISQGDYFLSHRILLPKIETLASSDLVDLIQKEIRRLVFGHRLGQDMGDLKKLFVIGNGAVDDLLKKLTAAFPIPVEKVNPLKRISMSESLAQSQQTLRYSDRYAATLGMLLKMNPNLRKA